VTDFIHAQHLIHCIVKYTITTVFDMDWLYHVCFVQGRIKASLDQLIVTYAARIRIRVSVSEGYGYADTAIF